LTEQICKFDIFESGVGSVVRKDLLLWINRNGAAGMGPWYDSIGAPIMAMKHGACYFPSFLASVHIAWTPEKLNYAKRIFHDPARAVEHFQHVKAFLDAREIRAVVPAEVLEVLETKATSDLPGGGRRFWRRIMDRAHALIANQCYAQADQWLRGVVRVFPREAEAYFALGIVQHKLGRLAEEELAFRRAVKLDPANAAARSNWGVCRQRQGFTADAIVAYQRAIEIDPGFAGAYANLGNLLSGEGRWEDALVPLQRLVQLRPLAAAGFVSLGNAYLALGRKAEALAAHRRAWELDPQSAAPVGHVEISHARSRTP
jgi:tetratricopeptide (TPR) repeat protein